MNVLDAAIVLVGVIALLNLLLTLGLVRRLREHTDRLNRLSAGRVAGRPDPQLRIGDRPPEFEAATVDGRRLTGRDAPLLVGFFARRCQPCKEWVPRFARAAGALPGGRERALAVVVGTEEETADLVAQLRPAAMVVTEELDGPMGRSFGVAGYPTLYRLAEDGTVAATDPYEVVTSPVAG
ncbi:TlpA family protein disulfide reductase [Actinocatenispora thailandica]|uniref:TlpA family protein disulfide reductase n=1 Tax=Actinocatenispora thailandica TaxID=227318 RepID=UPI00194F2F0A|nr:redoxin domain-containing protein [Actinocatenispora thailandica]